MILNFLRFNNTFEKLDFLFAYFVVFPPKVVLDNFVKQKLLYFPLKQNCYEIVVMLFPISI